MSAVRRLGLIALIALPLSAALLPQPLFSQDAGRPEAGRDPRRGVETDERRRQDDARRDERGRNAAEAIGRRSDITTRRNSEFRDANALGADIAAQRSAEAKFSDKINAQMTARGWSEKDVRDLLKTEPVGMSIDGRNGKTDSASVYGKHGEYVVINDRTKEIVQISDKKDPRWKDDSRIHWR
jgi:hypothetical protein